MIIAILLLLISSSFGVCYIYGIKRTMQWIILLFGAWFIGMNTGFFINQNKYYIILVFSIPFISLITYIFYSLWLKKNLIISKENLKNFKYILLISVGFLLLFTTRLWINKFNGDALFYANISKKIKLGQDFSVAKIYQNVSYYYLASLANNPIDMYTIAGDLIQQFVAVIAIVLIVNKKTSKTILVIIFTIFGIILYGISNTFASSSLNWTAVTITILVICALGMDEWMWTIFTPIAFSVFSLSSTLVFPCVMMTILFKKKVNLKELFMFSSLSILGLFVLISGVFELPRWTNLFMPIMILFFFISYKFASVEFIINNLLFFENEIITLKKKKIAIIILASVAMLIAIALYIKFSIKFTSKISVLTDIFTITTWIAGLSLFIYQLLFEEKVCDSLKFTILLFVIQSIYIILTKAVHQVPWYIYIRLSSSVFLTLPILLFLELVKYFNKEKFSVIITTFIATLVVANSAIRIVNNINHQKLILKYNNTIAKQYYWITPNELKSIRKIIEGYKGQVFSDLPLFVLPDKVNSIPMVSYRDSYFYGMAATMEKYAPSEIYNSKKMNKENESYKFTLEYARHFNHWANFDKVDMFIFRNEKYANWTAKHYKGMKLQKTNDLFILTK